jgi:hypothetical protein
MKSWILAVSLLAAAGATASAARAADLDEGSPPDRYGSAYDDPRYADIYRHPQRPPSYAPSPPPPYAVPVPRERIYRDDHDDLPPYARRHRYGYNDPRPDYGAQCVPRELIRERLMRHGWHDFHDGALRGNVAVVRARRPSGRLFELTVERCSGEIVTAYPLQNRVYGPFAYGPRPWWQRPYH